MVISLIKYPGYKTLVVTDGMNRNLDEYDEALVWTRSRAMKNKSFTHRAI
jgi:hypothetical protein